MLAKCTMQARSTAMLQLQRRSMHTVFRSASAAIGNEAPVQVYSSSEFAQFNDAYNSGNWDQSLMRTGHVSKFFSLMPFFAEAAITPKHFVLKMELFPEAQYLKLWTLKLSGVQVMYVPIKQMIPVTNYDYWAVHWFWTKQNQILDLDMVYANLNSKEMYVFDKYGTWHDEGVDHDALSMEKTYNETNWYDEFNVHNF